jgi:probable addiction module antidote protein
MPVKTVPWDSAAALRNNQEIAAYIDAVLEVGDPTLLAHALGVVARAKGMTSLAKETGMGRESLYKSLSNDGNPSFSTVINVLSVLGVKLHAMPIRPRLKQRNSKRSRICSRQPRLKIRGK